MDAPDGGMNRLLERAIDLVALVGLLVFTYTVHEDSPLLAGVVVSAAVQFWLTKNASATHKPDPAIAAAAEVAALRATEAAEAARSLVEAAAKDRADVLATAKTTAEHT